MPTPREPLIVISELFDQIGCGTITLSVPLKEDIIQMGARDCPDKGTLRVHKGRRTATVQRIDGKPMQAEIIHAPENASKSGTHCAPSVSTVFHQPVQTLRLKRQRHNGGKGWQMSATLPNLNNSAHITQFLDVIGAFGLGKQPIPLSRLRQALDRVTRSPVARNVSMHTNSTVTRPLTWAAPKSSSW